LYTQKKGGGDLIKKIIICLVILSFQVPLSVYSQDPTNKSECMNMLQSKLQVQCNTLLGKEKPETLQACLDNIYKEVEKQCDRFFGGDNFCSACTSECIKQYKETDPTRTECLEVCFRNPACKKH
jgi:hypothetical protein